MILGDKVRELRENKGWSQTDLARAAGVSQPTIASIEGNKQQTSKYSIKIAAALGVNVVEIDPDYVIGTIPSQIDVDLCGLAFEVIIQALQPELTPQRRRGLAAVFLNLARTDLVGDNVESHVEQLRSRLLHLFAHGLQQ